VSRKGSVMKRLTCVCFAGSLFLASVAGLSHPSAADDTCLFVAGYADLVNTFTAPVVPAAKTMSSDRIYLVTFRTSTDKAWVGSVARFGVSSSNTIIDENGNAATEASGALKDTAEPSWATIDWATPGKGNYIHHTARHIFTYLGSSRALTDLSNRFDSTNVRLTPDVLGNPTHSPAEIIDYVRGADVFDEDGDGETLLENRETITGDVLHSEPLAISYEDAQTVVYFGANDGMLHAVKDSSSSPSAVDDGKELWAFIPPDQLHRLKDMVEGTGHQYYVDSSPKVYIQDINGNGIIETDVDSDGDGDVDENDRDRVILVCGERKGGTSYFALDVTHPTSPIFLWRINQSNDQAGLNLPVGAAPDVVVPELGETWSEPEFGMVKVWDDSQPESVEEIPVFFMGAGYSPGNDRGKAILAVHVLTGEIVKKFSLIAGMGYGFPSSVALVDSNGNGFVDKLYVGDLGGQIWRFGKFTDASQIPEVPMPFPRSDENINHWSGHVLLRSDPSYGRKFFYPPSVTLESGYDLVFSGSGNREAVCDQTGWDRIYCIKDTHDAATLQESDLADVTVAQDSLPDLNSDSAKGWYIRLAEGEKILAEGLVAAKTYYVTSFTPINDSTGGVGKLYALDYKTGEVLFIRGGETTGGSIPSRPVMLLNRAGQRLFVSVGLKDNADVPLGAGILALDPIFPPTNFFYLWWKGF
jgi:type IV pilus assembly protein PilY1